MDLSMLNEHQRKAVETTEGPVLILAGAGSGKTRALTYRIAYLIEEKDVSPYNILALTFTNKAAKEMRERVCALAGHAGGDVWVSTFHSCCAKMLRIDIERIGFDKNFVIYDEGDQLSLIGEVQKDLKFSEEEYPRKQLRALFSDAKNRSLNAAEYLANASGMRSDGICAAFKRYEKKLRENNALDFDDLLNRTLELFEKCPDVLEKYQRRFMYVHVDEYQDTNITQYHFVQLLSKHHKNLCVVGDDDQSIYGWRGADLRNILEFERDFPQTTVLRLEQNYRSSGFILDAANAVIANNIERKKKKLWTEQGKGDKLTLYTAWSERDEADYICRTISTGSSQGRPYGDFAVLYRTNAQSRAVEESLVGYGIPYSVYGSLRFYDRKEIKDILAYLKLMVNPKDEISLRRIINLPKRGIGDTAVAELERAATERGVSLFDAVLFAEELNIGRAKGKITAFGQMMQQLLALRELLPLSEFVKQLLDMSDFWKHLDELKLADGKKDEARRENVEEFVSAVAEFESTIEGDALSAFLENVALVANVNDESNSSSVTLMTLHSAKGLEFPVVFLCGMEEGVFPTNRAFLEESTMAEERRLCYVGITRAREKLYLLHAQSRMLYNQVVRHPVSRFVGEIPRTLFEGMEEKQQTTEQSWGKPAPRFGYGSQTIHSTVSGNTMGAAKASVPLGGTVLAPPSKFINTNKTFVVGQAVKHARFGRGQVTASDGGVLTIAFDTAGEKKIVAAYAPIEPLEE